MGQRAALYCRVSTADQSCARQERDLAAFAARAGYEVVGVFKETASEVRHDRAERRKVLALAQRRKLDAVLVTELSRWGRSTTDLLATLRELEARRVSLVALNGVATAPSGPNQNRSAAPWSLVAAVAADPGRTASGGVGAEGSCQVVASMPGLAQLAPTAPSLPTQKASRPPSTHTSSKVPVE